MRRMVIPLSALVLFALGACRGENRSESEQLSELSQECDLAGDWRLTETAVEEQCREAPVEEASLHIENEKGVYSLELRIPDEAAMTCSGVPDPETCSLEATCSGFLGSREVEVALELTFHGGRVSGRQRIDTREPVCESTYDVKGERASSAAPL